MPFKVLREATHTGVRHSQRYGRKPVLCNRDLLRPNRCEMRDGGWDRVLFHWKAVLFSVTLLKAHRHNFKRRFASLTSFDTTESTNILNNNR